MEQTTPTVAEQGTRKRHGHALVVGIGRFTDQDAADAATGTEDGAESAEEDELPLEASQLDSLDFAGPRAADVAAALSGLGYSIEADGVLRDPTVSQLQSALDSSVTNAGAATGLVVHLLSHGRTDNQGGLYIAARGHPAEPGLDIESWLRKVQSFSAVPAVLLLLDVCFAGCAVDWQWNAWRKRLRAEERRVWILAAAESGQLAFEGRFSRAVSHVLQRLREDGLGTSALHEFVPLHLVAREIRSELHRVRLRDGGLPQIVDGTPVALGEVPEVSLFPNPRYRKDSSFRVVARVEELLREFLAEVDPVLDGQHFMGRALAHPAAASGARRSLFTGCEEELTNIAHWLEDPDGPALRVVTGGPGHGKSALLGMTVCAAHPELRSFAFELLPDTPLPGRADPFTFAAVHARGHTATELLDSVARQLGIVSTGVADAPFTVVELGAALDARVAAGRSRTTLVVDALDEAADPGEVLDLVIRPLLRGRSGRGGPSCRVLVGTRRENGLLVLLAEAADAGTLIDLDTVPAERVRTDLARYVTRCLEVSARYDGTGQAPVRRGLSTGIAAALTAGRMGGAEPEVQPGTLTLTGDRETSTKGPNLPPDEPGPHTGGAGAGPGPFLLAGVYLHHLLTGSETVTLENLPTTLAEVPCTLPAMLDMHLAQIGTPWARPVLTALAFAKGQGMPSDLLAAVAAHLKAAGAPMAAADADPQQIAATVRALGFYVRSSAADTDSTALHRLYHQELVSGLRDAAPEGTATGVFQALLATVGGTGPGSGGAGEHRRPRWNLAYPYLLRHLAQHAADTDALDGLLSDPEFLVHADAEGVLQHLGTAGSRRARIAATVFRTSGWRAEAADSRVRRETLAVDAARFNQPELYRDLTAGGLADGMAWGPLWATGSQVSEALTGTFPEHTGPVTALYLDTAAERARVVSGSRDGIVHVRDFATGQALGRPLRAHAGPVHTLDLTVIARRTVLISGGEDGVRLWDLESRRPLDGDMRHGTAVAAVAVVSWQGRLLTACARRDGTISVTDPAEPFPRWFQAPSGIVSLAVLPLSDDASDRLPVLAAATVGRDGRLWLGHLDSETLASPRFRAPVDQTSMCTVTTGILDGRPVFLTGDASGQLTAWGIEPLCPPTDLGAASGKAIRVLATEPTIAGSSVILTAEGEDLLIHRPAQAALPEPDADQLPAAGQSPHTKAEADDSPSRDARQRPDGETEVSRAHRRASAPAPERLSGHRGMVTAARVGRTASGELVAVSGGQDGTLRTWRISRADRHASPLEGHPAPVTALAGIRHGDRDALASAAGDTLWIRDAETGERLAKFPTGQSMVTSCVAAHCLGVPALLTGGTDGTLRVWDAESGTALLPPLAGHLGWISSVAVGSLSGVPIVATGGKDHTVRLWDLATGAPLGDPLTTHQGPVTSIALSTTSDGQACLASGGEDRKVGLWRLAPDGRATPRPVRTLHQGAVSSVCLLPSVPEAANQPGAREAPGLTRVSGLLVASAGTDRTIRLWDAADGAPCDPAPRPHDGAVTSLAAGGPHGPPVLISTGRDHRIRTWDLADRRPAAVYHLPSVPGHACLLPRGRLAVSLGRDVLVLWPTGPA